MEAPPPRRRDSPPAIPDELFEEFLLRLPPDDPACLLRASLVCKAWSHTVSSPRFRRRLHELHGTPPVLGFLHNWEDDLIPRFISTTASSFPLAAPDRRTWRWRALDCRHGRALFLPQEPISGFAGLELLLWEPITGAQQHIPLPAEFQSDYPTAAVFCAADGCDHRDCLGGPFRVVFLFSVLADDEETYVTSTSVYSSETGAWGELTSVPCTTSMEFTERVPCYGEGALEGDGMLNKPGCALLTKDSSGDVPKSAPNLCLCFHPGFPGVCECTTRRDDARNSTTSESNVDDAPRLEKGQQQVEEETKR